MLTVEQIRAVVADYFQDKPVKKVWLFGSYARGEAREDSDVDLLVTYDETQKILSWFDTLRLQIGLEDSLQKEVQLVEDGRVYHRFAPYVEADKSRFMKDNAALLHFVLEQIEGLHRYVADVSEAEFYADEQLRDACCMKILVIGEYCGKLSHQFKSAHPEIDWRLVKAARNYYAHDYGDLTPQRIWTTIQNDIPGLETTLRDVLKGTE